MSKPNMHSYSGRPDVLTPLRLVWKRHSASFIHMVTAWVSVFYNIGRIKNLMCVGMQGTRHQLNKPHCGFRQHFGGMVS